MKRIVSALVVVALSAVVALSQPAKDSTNLEEVTKAGAKAIAAGDLPTAESYFRQAVKLAPRQGFWRIQLVLVLGQQKKWKAALEEIEPLARNGATDWVVTMNRNLPDGKVAFINSDQFRNEQTGIARYVAALKQTGEGSAIARDIGVKLDAFADEHKFALIYDISKFKALPFEKGNTQDVTAEFIAYYNRSEYTQKYFGTVYLYRGVDDTNYGTQIIILNPEAIIYLNGQAFLRMSEKTFIGFRVPVGRYLLQMGGFGAGARHVLDVAPNGTYYLRVEQHVYPIKFQSFSIYVETTALEQIRSCYVLSEKKIATNPFDSIRTNPADAKK